MIILYLACANDEEAKNIAKAVLEAKLVVCTRRCPIKSSHWWDGEIQNDDEVLLMMESLEDKFDDINKIVARLHSYNEYVLTTVNVQQTTPGVTKWLHDIIR